MWELLEGRFDRANGIRPWVDQFSGIALFGCYNSGAVWHLAVSECRAVLDDQNALPCDAFGITHNYTAGCLDHLRHGVVARGVVAYDFDGFGACGVHFVDDQHMRAAEVDLAGIVGELVSRAVR